MFMIMSQICLYLHKATRSLQQPITTEDIQLQFGINTNFHYSTQSSDNRQLVDGVQLLCQFTMTGCTQNAIYQRSIYLYDITVGPHEQF